MTARRIAYLVLGSSCSVLANPLQAAPTNLNHLDTIRSLVEEHFQSSLEKVTVPETVQDSLNIPSSRKKLTEYSEALAHVFANVDKVETYVGKFPLKWDPLLKLGEEAQELVADIFYAIAALGHVLETENHILALANSTVFTIKAIMEKETPDTILGCQKPDEKCYKKLNLDNLPQFSGSFSFTAFEDRIEKIDLKQLRETSQFVKEFIENMGNNLKSGGFDLVEFTNKTLSRTEQVANKVERFAHNSSQGLDQFNKESQRIAASVEDTVRAVKKTSESVQSVINSLREVAGLFQTVSRAAHA